MQNVPNGPTGEAMPDPMLSIVRAYEAERERCRAAANDADDDHLGWLYDRLVYDTPPIYTDAGAIAAARLVADSLERHAADPGERYVDGLSKPLAKAVRKHLKGCK